MKLSIKLNGKATNAAVSVAVVQANRIEIKNKNDIENYTYLTSELGDIPVKENYLSNEDLDKRDLENVLLIKGWSRYKWTDVLKVRAEDTLQYLNELAFTGRVTRLAGKFKQPVSLVTFGPANMYETDINGNFVVGDGGIITEPGKKISMMVASDNPSDFNIQLISPYDSLNKQMANLIEPVVYPANAQESSARLQLPGNERSIRLKEVVIKDKKINNSFYGSSYGGVGANACGDYVCMYNILNCPNHRNAAGNTPPVPGQLYQGRVYTSCQTEQTGRKSAVTFKGIYAAQEFYPSDYSEVNPSQPEYISTLYWKHQLMLQKGKAQEVSFYTSDITGPFKVIVQGITDSDVIYGETKFSVTK